MRSLRGLALVLTLALPVAACGDKAPSGQVAAKVGKEEITVQELQAELGGAQAPDAKTRKAMEAQALSNIVQRKLLASAARDAKIDKAPAYAVMHTRMEDTLLVQALQQSLVAAVPEPSKEQVQQYIAQNPSLYANRKVYVVDQLRMPAIRDPKLLEALKPLHSNDEIAALLQARGVPSQRSRGTLDVLTLPPEIASQIEKVPADDVFVLPVQGTLVSNKILETRVEPLVGDNAAKHAAQMIRTKQASEAVSRQFKAVIEKPKVKVLYNKAYDPAAAKPAAPAKP